MSSELFILNAEEKYLVGILIVNFMIGLLLVLLISKQQPEKRNSLRLKYGIYLLLVIVCSVFLMTGLCTWLAVLLMIGGGLELLSVSKRQSLVQVLTQFSVYLLLCLGTLYLVHKHNEQLFFIYVLVVVFDGYSQLTGQLLGKHKLAKATSPGKTVEGFFGGIFGVLLVIFFMPNAAENSIGINLLYTGWFAITALGGDLLASKWKRNAGIKDFNNLIPAHGGLLDRFDSFIGVCGCTGISLFAMNHLFMT
jgi:phosphatidate cytidylyltransferase